MEAVTAQEGLSLFERLHPPLTNGEGLTENEIAGFILDWLGNQEEVRKSLFWRLPSLLDQLTEVPWSNGFIWDTIARPHSKSLHFERNKSAEREKGWAYFSRESFIPVCLMGLGENTNLVVLSEKYPWLLEMHINLKPKPASVAFWIDALYRKRDLDPDGLMNFLQERHTPTDSYQPPSVGLQLFYRIVDAITEQYRKMDHHTQLARMCSEDAQRFAKLFRPDLSSYPHPL